MKDILIFFSNWYESMAYWLRQVAEILATWVLFLMSDETLCSALAILRGTEPVSALALWQARFLYFCTLYNFFILGFHQWQSSSDRVVNLIRTVRLALARFWRTWTRSLASTHPHVLAWHMAEIIAIVEPWRWLTTSWCIKIYATSSCIDLELLPLIILEDTKLTACVLCCLDTTKTAMALPAVSGSMIALELELLDHFNAVWPISRLATAIQTLGGCLPITSVQQSWPTWLTLIPNVKLSFLEG